MFGQSKWTQSQVDEMQRLWAEGKSYSQIGLVFGVTRFSISGFFRRNKDLFPPKGSSVNHAPRVKAKRKVTTGESFVFDPPKSIPHPPGVKSKRWIDLEANECQWHLNDGIKHFHDPASFTFACCGLTVVKGKRFCAYHERAARKKPQ